MLGQSDRARDGSRQAIQILAGGGARRILKGRNSVPRPARQAPPRASSPTSETRSETYRTTLSKPRPNGCCQSGVSLTWVRPISIVY